MAQKQAQSSNNNGIEATPDPEVVPRAKRRSFTAAYKLRVLEEADKCYKPGQIGALLRREGLYSSHLTSWRRQRKAGELAGLTSKKRGRKKDEQAEQMSKLRKENEGLRRQLQQAELIIDAQKKLSQALSMAMEGEEPGENS